VSKTYINTIKHEHNDVQAALWCLGL